jgi:hypothetical protein
MEFNSWNNFGKASCKKHPCKVGHVLKEEKLFKEIVDARTMDNKQWAITKARLADIVLR